MMPLNQTASAAPRPLNTALALALIPLSGFATDIYIPSLPDMADKLQLPSAQIQATLTIFLLSYGITQLFIGSLLDSFGRYLPNLVALFLFIVATFVIVNTRDILVIYLMRVVHGITISVITICKRSYFTDVYKGDKLKHYISLFSIIWSTAPILAPFLGGFLQTRYGWSANFYFLGVLGTVYLLLEILIGRESLLNPEPFQISTIVKSYRTMLATKDFCAGLSILGVGYATLIIFGMASPFLIEKVLHYSSQVTGYMALVSGVAVLMGGVISKSLLHKPFQQKLLVAAILMIAAAIAVGLSTLRSENLYTLLAFVLIIHTSAAFIFNNVFSYCLLRFPAYSGKSAGLTGGGFYIVASLAGTLLINILEVKTQFFLGIGYLILALATVFLLLYTKWRKDY